MKLLGLTSFFLLCFLPLVRAADLQGKVTVEGDYPANEIIKVDGDPFCRDLYPNQLENPVTLVNDEGGLRSAFVYLKEGVSDDNLQPFFQEVVLDQVQCMFEPRVLGLQVGQTLRFESHDNTIHNVRGQTKKGKGFNLGFPKPGHSIEKTFTEEEVMLELKGDVHGWKRAYVGILNHPYYAVTRSSGSFTIENVPPGKYVLEVWHERLGLIEKEIEMTGETQNIDLTYSIEK